MELWVPSFWISECCHWEKCLLFVLGCLSRCLLQSPTANEQRCAEEAHHLYGHKALKQIWPQCSCQLVPSSELGLIYKHLKVKPILKNVQVSGKSRLFQQARMGKCSIRRLPEALWRLATHTSIHTAGHAPFWGHPPYVRNSAKAQQQTDEEDGTLTTAGRVGLTVHKCGERFWMRNAMGSICLPYPRMTEVNNPVARLNQPWTTAWETLSSHGNTTGVWVLET